MEDIKGKVGSDFKITSKVNSDQSVVAELENTESISAVISTTNSILASVIPSRRIVGSVSIASMPIIKENSVTPEQFGAKGDGITDDKQAIEQAINTGLPVYFSDKTYLVSTPINITNNRIIWLYGEQYKNNWEVDTIGKIKAPLGLFISDSVVPITIRFVVQGIVVQSPYFSNEKINVVGGEFYNNGFYCNTAFKGRLGFTNLDSNSFILENTLCNGELVSDCMITGNYFSNSGAICKGVFLGNPTVSDTTITGNFFDYWLYVHSPIYNTMSITYFNNVFNRVFRVVRGGGQGNVSFVCNAITACNLDDVYQNREKPTIDNPPSPDMVKDGQWRKFGFYMNDIKQNGLRISAIGNIIRDSDVFLSLKNIVEDGAIVERDNTFSNVQTIIELPIFTDGTDTSISYLESRFESINNNSVEELPPFNRYYVYGFEGMTTYFNNKLYHLHNKRWYDADGNLYS